MPVSFESARLRSLYIYVNGPCVSFVIGAADVFPGAACGREPVQLQPLQRQCRGLLPAPAHSTAGTGQCGTGPRTPSKATPTRRRHTGDSHSTLGGGRRRATSHTEPREHQKEGCVQHSLNGWLCVFTCVSGVLLGGRGVVGSGGSWLRTGRRESVPPH